MADNVTTTGGDELAFDEVEIGGRQVKVARNKFGFGDDGEYREVGEDEPLPVKSPGSATEAKQDATIAVTSKLGSAKTWAAIVPDDDNDLPMIPDAMSCEGEAGLVVLQGADGNAETFSFETGQIRPFAPIRVLAEGTTATGLMGLFA